MVLCYSSSRNLTHGGIVCVVFPACLCSGKTSSPSPPTARAAMLNSTTPILTGSHCNQHFNPRSKSPVAEAEKYEKLATANNCVFHHKEKASLPQDKAGTQKGRGELSWQLSSPGSVGALGSSSIGTWL